MSKTATFTTIALLLGVILGGYLFVQNTALGSVIVGGEYQVEQLTSTDTGTSTIKTRAGSLGQIVVASTTGAGAIDFYATSSTTAATSSNDLIMSFPANVDEGTYTFDFSFAPGLLIDVENTFDGDYLLMWR